MKKKFGQDLESSNIIHIFAVPTRNQHTDNMEHIQHYLRQGEIKEGEIKMRLRKITSKEAFERVKKQNLSDIY